MKQEKNIWEQSRVELFQKLDCRETGLSQEDAALRLLKYGANELHAGKQKSVWQIFLGQFADFLVLILILAAVISACMGDVESMIVILAVITMNAILGTVQTVKASASLDSLKQMSAPTAKVLRDGQIVQIPGREVVPGDVVILEAGDSVCADGRLLECASLKCAESALTGESLPVEKDTEPLSGETALGDRKNMVFSGSFATYGRGRFLVTATGMDTEMGKIAQLLKNTEERKTPLQVSLDQFGRKLSIIILVICAVLFGVSVLWRHENVMNAFLFAVALAVAAIPEALSSIVTIVLSFGTRKMAKENAIIRHLQAVEGLGSVSVICSDKTGTLTQNRMTVRKLYTGGEVIDANDADFRDPLQEPLLRTALLCSDAVISGDTEIGDPTETALVRLGETNGFDEDLVRDRWPRLTEIPFDSDRKMMSTVHKLAGGLMLVTKGATDVLLDRCVVTPEERTRIEQVNEQEGEHDGKEVQDANAGEIGLEHLTKGLAQSGEVEADEGGGNDGVHACVGVGNIDAGDLAEDAQHPGDEDAVQDAALDLLDQQDGGDEHAHQREDRTHADAVEGLALEVLVGDEGRIAVDDQLCVLQTDKSNEQANAHADGALQGHGNGIEDALAHIGQGQCNEDDALNKDGHQSQLPAVTHGQHDRVGKVGVQAHAGGQSKRVVGQQSHQGRAHKGCQCGGDQHSLRVHAGSRQDVGVDRKDVGHGHESGNTCHDLGLCIGVVFLQMKDIF